MIVVLRFAGGIRVDIVTGLNEKAAIADFASRALSNGADLPLLEAKTVPVTVEQLSEIINGAPKPPPPLRERPPIPLRGLMLAMQAYVRGTTGTAPKIENARDVVSDFFAHYGCKVDFTGEPAPKDDPDAR